MLFSVDLRMRKKTQKEMILLPLHQPWIQRLWQGRSAVELADHVSHPQLVFSPYHTEQCGKFY